MADTLKGWETERLISFLQADSKLEDLKLNNSFFTKLHDEKISGDKYSKSRISGERGGLEIRRSLTRYRNPCRFFERAEPQLDDDDLGILRKQKVDGQAFLELTKEELLAPPYYFPGGPAIKLAKEIKASKKSRSLWTSRLRNQEDKVQRSVLEGFAYETNKMKRKRVDDDFDYLYGIVTSARDWHFLIYGPGEISQASELPFTIEFNKEALDKDSEEYVTLPKNAKLEAENAELRKDNTEIPDLRNKLLVFDAEIAELKRRNAEAIRANEENNERRDAKVKKLEARLAIVEQNGKETIPEVLPEISAPNNNTDDKIIAELSSSDDWIEIMIKEKRINRTRKVYEFTEKIGIDKIKYIKTYNANAIADLSVSQIQTIIDYSPRTPTLNYQMIKKALISIPKRRFRMIRQMQPNMPIHDQA
ncbi:hypothetical protein GLOIN_2v1709588 [Rhizophagus clarus]|uniref:Uncharacterized protein n=1 Tax=Rhizophagus clarus TaxID=94130 RepID=A0A8H3QGC3_9GLOM|nr:hypothetical protein GLOIN_2v1709588 [Rhizophagus clarus]